MEDSITVKWHNHSERDVSRLYCGTNEIEEHCNSHYCCPSWSALMLYGEKDIHGECATHENAFVENKENEPPFQQFGNAEEDTSHEDKPRQQSGGNIITSPIKNGPEQKEGNGNPQGQEEWFPKK